jgi:hypothetical protein
MRLVARRVGLFVVRKDGFHGWACNVELGDEEAFRALTIPHDVPSILATATATGMYLGPIPATPAHAALLAVLGTASRDVAVAVVRAGGRAAMLLVVDDLGDTLDGTRSLEEIARAAGESLTRLIKS